MQLVEYQGLGNALEMLTFHTHGPLRIHHKAHFT